MKQEYEALFTPWKIGNVEIKNRIVLCPMGGTSLFGWMEPNHFDKEAANFFFATPPSGLKRGILLSFRPTLNIQRDQARIHR